MCLLVLGSLTACDLFRKAPTTEERVDDDKELAEIKGRVVYNPQTGEYETVYDTEETPADTARLTELPNGDIPKVPTDPDDLDIATGDGLNIDYPTKERYRIALLLPFLSNRFNGASLPKNSDYAIGFYAGAKLALEQLESEGVRADVVAVDTEAENGTVQRLLDQPDVRDADLLIGPYLSNSVQLAAEAVKGKPQILVSPHSANIGLSTDNPNYVQVNPSIIVHINAQLRHARTQYAADQILLVGAPGGDAARLFPYYDAANAAFDGGNAAAALGRMEVGPDEATGWDDINLLGDLDSLRTNVLILPEYRNQRYVYNFLRKLKIAARNPLHPRDVVVYGMPQWQEFTRIEYDLYEDLNVHISSSHYVDRNSQAVRRFADTYRNRYGERPPESAYAGYDNLLYFGRLLQRYGPNLIRELERQPADLLHTRFDFERVLPPGTNTAEGRPAPVQQWENKFVHILAFRGYQFQPAR